jgi:hypothetical protein
MGEEGHTAMNKGYLLEAPQGKVGKGILAASGRAGE